jgi:hypothetical protein
VAELGFWAECSASKLMPSCFIPLRALTDATGNEVAHISPAFIKHVSHSLH